MRFQQKGFTLIELLVVIAIMAIMALIALPNMSQWLAARRVAGQAEQVANLLRFARAEAVRLNAPVYVCPVSIRVDGTANVYCDPANGQQGMAAFADVDRNGSYTRNTDTPLRTVILNSSGSNAVAYTFENLDFSGASKGSNQIWAFLPNGSFGHTQAQGGTLSMGDGFVKIAMTDARAADDDARVNRASVVLVDSSGRASVCAKKDERKICQFKASSGN
ncbi:MAG: Tfp pilus assembly protein FimT/FimU [Neisseria sp.]|nr:Tfp pilus assembly protein FimT/FimU [Neisseria sp.]